jgi:hypothetical protein
LWISSSQGIDTSTGGLLNPQGIDTSTGGLLFPQGIYSSTALYLVSLAAMLDFKPAPKTQIW